MLSLFPQLFDFVIPATAVLRIIVGIVFILEGKRNFFKTSAYVQKSLAFVEIIGGILFFIGLFVQPVSIVLSFSVLARIYNEYRAKSADKRIYSFYILLFFITISFLFLGPGMVSLDYPL
jgi:uncharacterized membrane protein YphA (DoxX/SURF4 family)